MHSCNLSSDQNEISDLCNCGFNPYTESTPVVIVEEQLPDYILPPREPTHTPDLYPYHLPNLQSLSDSLQALK
jgi:hypothetical protein